MSEGFVSEGIVFVRRDEEGVLVAVQMGQRAPIARELAGRGLGRAPLSPPPYRGSGLGSSALDRRLRAGGTSWSGGVYCTVLEVYNLTAN